MGKLGMGVLGLAADAIDKHGIAALSPAAMLMGLGKKDKKDEAAPALEDAKKKQAAAMGRGMKKGGKVKKCAASKRGDGCAQRGKTRGKMV